MTSEHLPLAGIQVVDFGRFIAGPFCGALLADFGADVIRVEKREGKEDRTVIPLDAGGAREGAVFVQANRNKRSLTLDPRTDEGREVVRRLIRRADVIIANLPGAALVSMGIDFETVSAINPRAILAVITAFGLDGPYASRVGFDGIAQAMSGVAYLSGTKDQPSRSAAPWVDFGTATLAAFGIMAALRARDLTGKGQLVEGALLRTALTFFSPMLIEESVLGLRRTPSHNRSQNVAPMDIFRTRDGWITIAVTGDPVFRRAARLIAPDWLDDPRMATDKLRGDHADLVSARVQDWCATRSTSAAITELEAAKVPVGPVYDLHGVLTDPHVASGDFFTTLDTPTMGRVPVATTPVKLHDTPGSVRSHPPMLGEHNVEILLELGYTEPEIATLRASGAV